MGEYVIEIKEAEFENIVKKSKGLVMVDFWASWCGPCQAAAPAIEAVAGKTRGKIKIYKINIDDNHKLASDLGVMSIPTMIIFKDGVEKDRIVGTLGEAEMVKKIEANLA